MKLVSNKTQVYNGKQYYKFFTVIPNKLIEKLNWKGGEELEAEIRGDELVIKKK